MGWRIVPKDLTLYKKNIKLLAPFKDKVPKKVSCDNCGRLVLFSELKKVDILFTRVCSKCRWQKKFR